MDSSFGASNSFFALLPGTEDLPGAAVRLSDKETGNLVAGMSGRSHLDANGSGASFAGEDRLRLRSLSLDYNRREVEKETDLMCEHFGIKRSRINPIADFCERLQLAVQDCDVDFSVVGAPFVGGLNITKSRPSQSQSATNSAPGNIGLVGFKSAFANLLSDVFFMPDSPGYARPNYAFSDDNQLAVDVSQTLQIFSETNYDVSVFLEPGANGDNAGDNVSANDAVSNDDSTADYTISDLAAKFPLPPSKLPFTLGTAECESEHTTKGTANLESHIDETFRAHEPLCEPISPASLGWADKHP